MPAGPGGHGGSEDRRIPPSPRAGGRPEPLRRRRERSPLRTLRGTGRVVPFRRARASGAPEELAPRQSRLLVAALATVLAGILVFTTVVLRPRLAPPGSDIVLGVSQFGLDQPQRIAFSSYPHVLPALGTAMYVVRRTSGWEAFADLPPDQVPTTTTASRCLLTWSAQASQFADPCTGATWNIDGTPAASGSTHLANLASFPVTDQGAFIDVNVGRLSPP